MNNDICRHIRCILKYIARQRNWQITIRQKNGICLTGMLTPVLDGKTNEEDGAHAYKYPLKTQSYRHRPWSCNMHPCQVHYMLVFWEKLTSLKKVNSPSFDFFVVVIVHLLHHRMGIKQTGHPSGIEEAVISGFRVKSKISPPRILSLHPFGYRPFNQSLNTIKSLI